MSRTLLIGFLLALLVGVVGEARAQVAVATRGDEPLAEVLERVREGGVDVVYAARLVENCTAAACRYDGPDAAAALACLLDGTGLEAQRVRDGQYVLARIAAAEATLHTLRGQVVDAETGLPLPGAHILVQTDGTPTGTATDRDGRFVLTLPGEAVRARASFLGYRSADTLLTAGGAPTLRLAPLRLTTQDVLVEARRAETWAPGAAAQPGVLAVPLSELATMPSSGGRGDLLHALQWTPGVEHTGEAGGGLSILGGAPDQNLYLLDGAPVYHPWHAFSLVSAFQTEVLQDATLYRGAFPTRYGGRLTAVLDAELRGGDDRRTANGTPRSGPQATAALGVLSARLLAEGPLTDRTTFMLSGRRSYLDRLLGREHAVTDDDGRRDTLRTGYYFYDLAAKLAHRFSPRHHLSISGYRGRDDLDLRLPFDLSLDFDSWLRPADLFFEVDHFWENRMLSARHRYLVDEGLLLTTTLYRSQYEAREASLVQPTASSAVATDYRVALQDLGLKLDADVYRHERLDLHAGLLLSDQRYDSALDADVTLSPQTVDMLRQRGEADALLVAAYAGAAWRLSERLELHPGLRLTSWRGREHVHLLPRLAARYALRDDVTLRASAGRQAQHLHRLRDRYALLYDLVSARWVPTGPELPPSTAWHLAAGADWQPARGLSLTADAFWRATYGTPLPADPYRDKDDLIGPGIDVGTLLGQYVMGRARAYGATVQARFERGSYAGQVTYTAARSLARAPDLDEDHLRPARFDVPRALRVYAQRATEHWTFGTGLDARAGYPDTVPTARYRLADPLDPEPALYLHRPEVNNGRLPAYVRLDLVGAYRFRWSRTRWQVLLQLYNATSRRNVLSRSYAPEEDEVTVTDRRGLPLLPLLEVEVQL